MYPPLVRILWKDSSWVIYFGFYTGIRISMISVFCLLNYLTILFMHSGSFKIKMYYMAQLAF